MDSPMELRCFDTTKTPHFDIPPPQISLKHGTTAGEGFVVELKQSALVGTKKPFRQPRSGSIEDLRQIRRGEWDAIKTAPWNLLSKEGWQEECERILEEKGKQRTPDQNQRDQMLQHLQRFGGSTADWRLHVLVHSACKRHRLFESRHGVRGGEREYPGVTIGAAYQEKVLQRKIDRDWAQLRRKLLAKLGSEVFVFDPDLD